MVCKVVFSETAVSYHILINSTYHKIRQYFSYTNYKDGAKKYKHRHFESGSIYELYCV